MSRRTHRHAMSSGTKRAWNKAADELLQKADEMWSLSADLDTAVRDSMAQGLAYIVNCAFDCRALAMEFQDLESWNAFIDNSTAQWFKNRGFVDWFCGAAASLFHTTPPRNLADVKIIRRKARRVRRAA